MHTTYRNLSITIFICAEAKIVFFFAQEYANLAYFFLTIINFRKKEKTGGFRVGSRKNHHYFSAILQLQKWMKFYKIRMNVYKIMDNKNAMRFS